MSLTDNAIRRRSNFKEKKLTQEKELGGKTLGIIGFGRIGQAYKAIGLGMNVCFHDKFTKGRSLNFSMVKRRHYY